MQGIDIHAGGIADGPAGKSRFSQKIIGARGPVAEILDGVGADLSGMTRMLPSEIDGVMDQLRGLALRQDCAPSDGQLLEAFVARRDAASFEALVRRHAAMVLGVCLRVVGNADDADDAFQATFLVLVRKAASIVPREQVGNWLYGVAYRTALKARSLAGRRRLLERPMTELPQPQATPDDRAELLEWLDRELERLPAKYRLPIVLCDLECRTRRDAARQLGLPTGTLSGRLTTAHRILAKRLARRGLSVTGAALAAALAGQATAGAPNDIISSTINAAALFAAGSTAAAGIVPGKAAALAEGVLKTMLLTKLKLATAVLASVVVIGAGVLAYDGPGANPGQSPREAPAKDSPKPAVGSEDQAKAKVEEAQRKVLVQEMRIRQAEAELEHAKAQMAVARAQWERAKSDYEAIRARAEKAEAAPEVPAANAKPDRAVILVRGYLRAARVVQVTSSVAGKVTEVAVQEGDLVKAGQLLASLDAGSFRNEVERAQVNVELAEAKLLEAKAGQTGEKDRQSAAASRFLVAQAELKRAGYELMQAKSRLEATQLRAPIAGVVVKRQVEVGSSVSASQGEATRLFEIIDPRMLVVAVQIPERDMVRIFAGQPVRIAADALPGSNLEGKVWRIAPTIDPATATVMVQVALKIPENDNRWKPGMSVRAAFQGKE